MKTMGMLQDFFQRHAVQLRRVGAALCVGLCATGVYGAVVQQRIADRVLRFHVLANSDTAADQAVKLQVRDAILAEFSDELLAQSSADAATAHLQDQLGRIQTVAENTLAQAGFNYPVTVTLRRELFPQKTYGSYRFPAGRYTALRVCLGDAAGKNWWCVLYPPLCVAGEDAREQLETVLTTADYDLIAGEDAAPQIKFKVVEWWQEVLAGDAAYVTNPDEPAMPDPGPQTAGAGE